MTLTALDLVLGVLHGCAVAAALFGVGYWALAGVWRYLPKDPVHRSEIVVLAMALGMLIWSQALVLLGQLGLLYGPLLQIGVVLGAMVALGAVYRPAAIWSGSLPMPPRRTLLPGILLLGAALLGMLLFRISSVSISIDAIYYHFAFPRAYLLHHGAIPLPDLRYNGGWMGADILYALTIDPQNPVWTIPSKVLNLLLGAILLLATYALCRQIGVGASVAGLAAALVLTTEPIGAIGAGKNDQIVAFAGLACVLAAGRFRQHQGGWIALMALLMGFALSVKVSAAILLLPLLLVLYTERAFRLRKVFVREFLWCAVLLLPLVLWQAHSITMTGQIYTAYDGYPDLFGQRPQYVKDALEAFARNNLELTPASLATHLVPLLLNWPPRIWLNDSLGWPYVLCLALGAVMLLVRRYRRHGWLYACAAGVLALFVLNSFEGRFLNRYIQVSPPLVFAFCALLLSDAVRRYKRLLPLIPLLTATALWFGQAQQHWARVLELSPLAILSAKPAEHSTRNNSRINAAQWANRTAQKDETVIMNKGMTYYIDAPYLNLGYTDSTNIRFDQITDDAFFQIMADEQVCCAIIYPGRITTADVLLRYLDEKMQLEKIVGRIKLYRRKD